MDIEMKSAVLTVRIPERVMKALQAEAKKRNTTAAEVARGDLQLMRGSLSRGDLRWIEEASGISLSPVAIGGNAAASVAAYRAEAEAFDRIAEVLRSAKEAQLQSGLDAERRLAQLLKGGREALEKARKLAALGDIPLPGFGGEESAPGLTGKEFSEAAAQKKKRLGWSVQRRKKSEA